MVEADEEELELEVEFDFVELVEFVAFAVAGCGLRRQGSDALPFPPLTYSVLTGAAWSSSFETLVWRYVHQ